MNQPAQADLPANDIELAYMKPDPVALMTEAQIQMQCKFTEDYYICGNGNHYLRCVLPLPITDTERDYCIGVWVKISKNNFKKIWSLWDDDKQASQPAFTGELANDVHLHDVATQGTKVEIQLTGPTSRPVITIKNKASPLYAEQHEGIQVQRASEYSDLCR